MVYKPVSTPISDCWSQIEQDLVAHECLQEISRGIDHVVLSCHLQAVLKPLITMVMPTTAPQCSQSRSKAMMLI